MRRKNERKDCSAPSAHDLPDQPTLDDAPPTPKKKLNRRNFLAAGTAIGLTPLADHKSSFSQTRRQSPQKQNSAQANYYEAFSEPVVEYSRDGVLQTTLRIIEADIPIREAGAVRIERTRCYNGQTSGPTLKIRPGEQLKIKLINELPENSDALCGKEHLNQPHCFNTTNIHTHGLHVSPKSPSDNSLLKIEPQTEYEYCFQVPEFHPPGTFWYHAHVHGSTALQVMNGLAGALIIEESKDQQILPEAKDLVWMIQEIVGKDAVKVYTHDHPMVAFTVNGKFQPTLRMRPGEVQRWRFINATATPGGYANLQLLDSNGRLQDMYMIAVDGAPLRRIQKVTQYILPPGSRIDVLTQLSATGKYRMMKRRFQGRAQDQVLAIVDVGGKSMNMKLPAQLPTLPAFFNPITDNEITKRRTLRFQICPDQARGDVCKKFPQAGKRVGAAHDQVTNAFLIDEKPYDPSRIDQSIQLGAVEEWEIINETGAEHPFHIHVNHFQVVREGISPEDWIWQDTVSLPQNGSVKIRSRFRTYSGRYLLHCHILLHSDMGMMQNVEVTGEGTGPCKPA
jgi:FtsP/CotA-like multicopper oxidase with cupredoxin domain